jgi:hypothetical protein
VCHQTVSLIARHLEATGLPTVCLASALDIIESGRVPRAVFVDYPLGHTAGRPFDAPGQRAIVAAALDALESTRAPGEIITVPLEWPGDPAWRAGAMDTGRGDTRQPRDTTPRYQCAADRVLAERAAREHGPR